MPPAKSQPWPAAMTATFSGLLYEPDDVTGQLELRITLDSLGDIGPATCIRIPFVSRNLRETLTDAFLSLERLRRNPIALFHCGPIAGSSERPARRRDFALATQVQLLLPG